MSEAGEVARFYRALGVTSAGGLPLRQALALLSTAESEPAGRARAGSLGAALARGGTLADGARGPPFTALEEALLRLGEETGCLDATLAGLAAFFEAEHRVARRVQARMVQPFVTGLAACFVLPAPLAVRFGAAAYLAAALPLFSLLLLKSGAAMWLLFTATRDKPRYAVGRLLWALATALEAGLPIQRAVQLAADALGPCATATALRAVPAASWQGRPLSETLPEVCRLPRTATVMIETMERTGDTVTTLRWLAKAFEEGTLAG